MRPELGRFITTAPIGKSTVGNRETMQGKQNDGALTAKERQALALLEAAAMEDDPALDARLRTVVGQPRWSARTMLLVAMLLMIIGTVVMATTFTQSLVLGIFGVTLLASGMAVAAMTFQRSMRR
jgi:hypothetical protein